MDTADEVHAEHARLLAVLAEAQERFARDKAAFLARWHARTPLPTDCCLDCLNDVARAEDDVAWFEHRNGLAR